MADISLETKQSPFFNVLSDAESIQVRELLPSNATELVSNLDEAIKKFDSTELDKETRSFIVTVKKPLGQRPSSPTPCSEKDAELTAVIQKAELLLKNEDYLLARNLYSYLLKRDIKNTHGLKGLGICLFNLGELNAAKKCFNALVELHQNLEGHALMGLCLVRENNDPAAYESFIKIKDATRLPNDLRFTFYKEFGNCLTRMERYNEASDSYHQALSQNPRSDTILINLGTLEIQRKRFEKATKYFQQAIDFNPSASKAFCGIALVAQMSGEIDIAELYFQKALDVDCQNSVALSQLYCLADTELDWKSLKIRLVQALIKEPTHIENRFLLAATLLKQNDWVGCENELNIILMKSPEHLKARQLKEEISLHKHRQGALYD